MQTHAFQPWIAAACGAVIFAISTPAIAQQVTGELGSPSATITIPGDVLPPPALPFGGEINLNADQSKAWWPPRVVPPKGAPKLPVNLQTQAFYNVVKPDDDPAADWTLRLQVQFLFPK